MSSSLTDSAALAASAVVPAAAAVVPGTASTPDDIDIRQRSPIKRLLPQTMFGRSLRLIMLPLILVQFVAITVSYGRHWETVSRRLAIDVAGDIGLTIEAIKFTDNQVELTRLLENASSLTFIDFSLERGASLPAPEPPGWSLFEDQLRPALNVWVARPYRIDPNSEPRDIRVQVQLLQGVLTADVPRKRLYTSTTYIFVLW